MQNRIPDDMLSAVLAEAIRLHTEATAGYSFEDLQQSCAEIQIPPHLLKKAIENVTAQRSARKLQRERAWAFLKQQLVKGLPLGAAIFVGAAPIVGFLRFYQPPEPKEVDSSLTTMTVKTGQLKYLADPKDLSITVRSISYREGISGVIGTDGYEDLPLGQKSCQMPTTGSIPSCDLNDAKVGESYTYQGLQTYKVKIIGVDRENVVFQIERVNAPLVSPTKALKDKLESLQKESSSVQEALEKQVRTLERENDDLKYKTLSQDNRINELEKENEALRILKKN